MGLGGCTLAYFICRLAVSAAFTCQGIGRAPVILLLVSSCESPVKDMEENNTPHKMRHFLWLCCLSAEPAAFVIPLIHTCCFCCFSPRTLSLFSLPWLPANLCSVCRLLPDLPLVIQPKFLLPLSVWEACLLYCCSLGSSLLLYPVLTFLVFREKLFLSQAQVV